METWAYVLINAKGETGVLLGNGGRYRRLYAYGPAYRSQAIYRWLLTEIVWDASRRTFVQIWG